MNCVNSHLYSGRLYIHNALCLANSLGYESILSTLIDCFDYRPFQVSSDTYEGLLCHMLIMSIGSGYIRSIPSLIGRKRNRGILPGQQPCLSATLQ